MKTPKVFLGLLLLAANLTSFAFAVDCRLMKGRTYDIVYDSGDNKPADFCSGDTINTAGGKASTNSPHCLADAVCDNRTIKLMCPALKTGSAWGCPRDISYCYANSLLSNDLKFAPTTDALQMADDCMNQTMPEDGVVDSLQLAVNVHACNKRCVKQLDGDAPSVSGCEKEVQRMADAAASVKKDADRSRIKGTSGGLGGGGGGR